MRFSAFSVLMFFCLPVVGCSDGSDEGESPGQGDDATSTGGVSNETTTPGDGDGDEAPGEGGSAPVGDGDTAGSGGTSAMIPAGLIPAFIGQGHMGRTMISCDDGRSWSYDQSNDVGELLCWTAPDNFDCDHDDGAGRGLANGNGQFFAMFGWGTPSTLRASTDGNVWDQRIEASVDQRYGGVAYLDGTLLAAGRYSSVSTDDGATWSEPMDTNLDGWNVRRAAAAGPHFVIVGDGDVVISSDLGASWQRPESLPAGCGQNVQSRGGIAYGDGTILVVGGDGDACTSTDGGRTFTHANVGGEIASHLVWSGTEFIVYGGGQAHRSSDGVTWASEALVPNLNIGPVAVSDEGTFVSVEGGWGDSSWYEGQEFYRSEDGINWEVLEAGTFSGGHPMRTMAFGYIEPSVSCPSE